MSSRIHIITPILNDHDEINENIFLSHKTYKIGIYRKMDMFIGEW